MGEVIVAQAMEVIEENDPAMEAEKVDNMAAIQIIVAQATMVIKHQAMEVIVAQATMVIKDLAMEVIKDPAMEADKVDNMVAIQVIVAQATMVIKDQAMEVIKDPGMVQMVDLNQEDLTMTMTK